MEQQSLLSWQILEGYIPHISLVLVFFLRQGLSLIPSTNFKEGWITIGIYMPSLSTGLSGGLIVVQQHNIGEISFFHASQQTLYSIVTNAEGKSWIILVVYVSNNDLEQKLFQSELQRILILNLPTMIVGDFNYIILAEEKRGGAPYHTTKERDICHGNICDSCFVITKSLFVMVHHLHE